jgi:sugar-specific transcriptional regulator TrmB
MEPISRIIEMLTQLGLTLNEAKVFFAILRNGTATAKAASKSSGVAREVVYRIIPQLQKKAELKK